MRLRSSAQAPPPPRRPASSLSPRPAIPGSAARGGGCGYGPSDGAVALRAPQPYRVGTARGQRVGKRPAAEGGAGGGRRAVTHPSGRSDTLAEPARQPARPRRRSSSTGRRPPAPPARSELPARPRHRKFSRAQGLREAERARQGGGRRAGPPSAWCRASGPCVWRTRGGAGLSPAPEPLSSGVRSRTEPWDCRGGRAPTPCPGCCRCWGAGRCAA